MGDREYDASGVDEDDKAGPAFESLRETTLFLIDGSRPMFERAGDEARPEMTHFDRALELLEGFMKQRIITADNDKIGAMVYGTRVSKNQSAFEMVYTLIDVDIPEAKQIKMIKGMIGNHQQIEEEIGSMEETPEAGALDAVNSVLFASAFALNQTSDTASKRIMILTTRERPEEGSDNVEILTDTIVSRVKNFKKRLYKKRSSTSITLSFTQDVQAAVQIFNLVRSADKPTAIQLEAVNNMPLRMESAYICQDTGHAFTFINDQAFEYDHKTVVLKKKEVESIKGRGLGPEIKILGYKPMRCLRAEHTMSAPLFLYPNDKVIKGSRAAFKAFWWQMLELNRFAVARYVRRKGTMPRLAALVPAEETKDQDGNQISPPGIHLIPLPYRNDLRFPEALIPPPAGGAVYASEEHIAAADDLISSMSLSEGWAPHERLANPSLQRFYQVLEGTALGENIPPLSSFQDDTTPETVWEEEGILDMETFQYKFEAPARVWKDAVYGAGYDAEVAAAAARASQKTAAKRKVPESDTEWGDALAQGAIQHFTVAILKEYCKRHQLKEGGKKGDLVERVTEHLRAAAGAATGAA